MAEPTLDEVWGTGTTRLTSGAAAPSAGLFIPSSFFTSGTNPIDDFTLATAEALLIKLLSHQVGTMTEVNRINDPTNRQIALVPTGADIVQDEALNLDFLRYSYALLAYEQTIIPDLNPNNF